MINLVGMHAVLGGEFFEEQLTVIKVIVEKVASYLLVSGLDVEVNLNGKIVTLNGEIMVRIDTPNEEEEDMRRPQGNDRSSTTTNCAIELKAQLSLKQLLEDSLEIEAFLNKAQQQGPNTITSNNNTTINNTTNKNSL